MAVHGGPKIATSGLVLSLDAANSKGFDSYENLFTYSQFPQSTTTSYPTGWNGWNPATILKSQTLSPDGVNYGVFHGAINQNGGGLVKYITGLTPNTSYYVSYYVKGLTSSELTYFTNNNARGTTTGTADGATNVAWFAATQVQFLCSNYNGTGASGTYQIPLTQNWQKVGGVIISDSAGSAFILISNNVGDTGTGNEDGGGTWMIGGAQLETGLTASTYYPTTGTTKTRGTTLADLSGGGNTGTLTNGPTYSSANGGSIVFDATNDSIIIPENSALNTQTPTVEVWVKTNATTQNGFWFEKGQVNTQYSLFQEGAVIQWRQNIGGSITNLSTTTATYMNTNSWYQVVATYTSGSRKLYINGTLVNSDAQTGTIATNANGMSIGVYGGYNGGRGYYYSGNIASVKIYNRELSADEVSQNFNATRGRYGV
jgi:hypothetical protein